MGKKVQTYFRPYVLAAKLRELRWTYAELAAAVQAKPERIIQSLRHRLPISSRLAYRVTQVFGDGVIFYA